MKRDAHAMGWHAEGVHERHEQTFGLRRIHFGASPAVAPLRCANRRLQTCTPSACEPVSAGFGAWASSVDVCEGPVAYAPGSLASE